LVDLSAYPNPFNPVTTIEVSLDCESPVSLRVYDIKGRLIRTLFNGQMAAGPHVRHWNGRDEAGTDVSSGVYVVRVVAGEAQRTLKLAVVR
jgi:flagellar hook assembly protein FlgD